MTTEDNIVIHEFVYGPVKYVHCVNDEWVECNAGSPNAWPVDAVTGRPLFYTDCEDDVVDAAKVLVRDGRVLNYMLEYSDEHWTVVLVAKYRRYIGKGLTRRDATCQAILKMARGGLTNDR